MAHAALAASSVLIVIVLGCERKDFLGLEREREREGWGVVLEGKTGELGQAVQPTEGDKKATARGGQLSGTIEGLVSSTTNLAQ